MLALVDARATMRYRLDALNFFLADVRGGLGAFVSVFLLTEAHWTAAQIARFSLSAVSSASLCMPGWGRSSMLPVPSARYWSLAWFFSHLCAVATERMPTGPVVFDGSSGSPVLHRDRALNAICSLWFR